MISEIMRGIDWFIPQSIKTERTELTVWRNFVFTHIAGPLLSQPISLFLYRTDPKPGFACWTMIICILAFLTMPFILKYSKHFAITAALSVQLLAFASLFGAFNYGGVSSPFLPWLMVALLLGFFYLSSHPMMVIVMFAINIGAFAFGYFWFGFPEIVPLAQLTTVGWISILSATVYMSWMAIFYATIMSTRSDLERESERHRETTGRLMAAKELADRANRAKSIFLAKMSHELRTPLNAVIGYSEILLEDLEASKGPASKKLDLERIIGAGKHLLSLVTDVLDIAKIESNTVDIKIERFDVAELIRDTLATCRPLIAVKNNRLDINCPNEIGTVENDATKLRQIVLNLVSNSAKFTTDGTIEISVGRERRGGDDWIRVGVKDTGIGISSSEMSRLFSNFGQATAETSNKFGGSGLGLVICKRSITLMGGDISLTSEVGVGSCFKLTFPARLVHPSRGAAALFSASSSTPVLAT